MPMIYNLSLIPPAANETSFQLIVNSTAQGNTSIWFGVITGAIAACAGAIIGSVISGYYLIRTVKEEKKLELFSNVFENLYAPFQNIIDPVIERNTIDNSMKLKLMELIHKNNKWVILCPDHVKKDICLLNKSLKNSDSDDIIIEKIKSTKVKIDNIIAEISFR